MSSLNEKIPSGTKEMTCAAEFAEEISADEGPPPASVMLQDDNAKGENKKIMAKQRLCLSHDIASQDEEPPCQTPTKPPFAITDAKKSREPPESQLELFPPFDTLSRQGDSSQGNDPSVTSLHSTTQGSRPGALFVYGNGQSTYYPNLEELDDTITVDSTTPFHQSSSAAGTFDPVARVVTAEKVNEAPLAFASEAPDYDKLVKEELKRARRKMIGVFAGILLIMTLVVGIALPLSRPNDIGTTPSPTSSLVTIFDRDYDPKTTTSVTLKNQLLSGTIPSELGLLSKLTELDLSTNILHGTLISELGLLTRLRSLHLGENELTGPLSSVLGRLTDLALLDLSNNQQLSGHIPTQLEQLVNLEKLLLYSTILNKSVPSSLCDGIDTRIDCGEIKCSCCSWYDGVSCDQGPNILGAHYKPEETTLLNLLALNGLSSWFPTELGLLTQLTELDVDFGTFFGPLPSELGLLTQMTRLAINNNDLSGEIPSELRVLTNLSELSLGNNALSGRIT